MNKFSTSKYGVLSVMLLCFFTMGFTDMVGIGSNYVQEELQLSNSLSGMMISVAFIWYLLLSVPTGVMMNRIGRKKTVLLAIGVTALSLVFPLLTLIPALADFRFGLYVFSFALLGMGNTFMQTSLNPLVSNVIGEQSFSSALALGQFAKALCSFSVPLIAGWGAAYAAEATGLLALLGWKVIFPISSLIAATAMLLLYLTPIREVLAENTREQKVLQEFASCFRLLRSPYVILCFLGVMCTAGLDIGTNSTAPKLLVERLGMSLDKASFSTSFYFIFRTIGCFAGSVILARFSDKKFYFISALMLGLSMLLMAIGHSMPALYTAYALAGFGNANLCLIIYARVFQSDSEHANHLAGLMVTGLFGAMVFPLIMGFVADGFAAMGWLPTLGSVLVMGITSIYLILFTHKL